MAQDFLGQHITVGDTVVFAHKATRLQEGKVLAVNPKTVEITYRWGSYSRTITRRRFDEVVTRGQPKGAFDQ
jgi:hypothetical protein